MCTASGCWRNSCSGHGQALGVLWRDKQIEYTRLVTTSNHGAHYKPFWELTRPALRYGQEARVWTSATSAGAAADEPVPPPQRVPENREVLQAPEARGVVTGILSNGDPDMLAVAVKSAGLDDLLDHVISVDRSRKYKPTRRLRPGARSHLGLAARSKSLFVSSNGWDALAATWYGISHAVGQPLPACL